MPRYQAEVVYLASIYPGKLAPIIMYHGDSPNPHHGRAKRYVMPPIVRGEKPVVPEDCKNVRIHKASNQYVAVLEIADAFENIPNPTKSDGMRMVFDSGPVSCTQIAENLEQTWGGNFIGLPDGAGPGIKIIAGTIPTQDELERLMEMQGRYYEFRLSQGDQLASENQWKEITREMRDAAAYLGKERVWASGARTEDCPACGMQIPMGRAICHHCHTRLRELPASVAGLNQAQAQTHAPVLPGKPQPVGA